MMTSLCFNVFVLLLSNGVSATNTSQGCTLNIPDNVKDNMEAEGAPLQINITMMIFRVRDVPDKGGSFGVDVG